MSQTYPIVAVTGSSGAGTTVVRRTFEEIFSARGISAAIIEGDSFHKYDREEMSKLVGQWERTAGRGISHFGPEANLFYEMDALFRTYGNSGSGVSRLYLHNEERASLYGKKPGTFTSWKDISSNTDLLFYEGLHGGVKYNEINIATVDGAMDEMIKKANGKRTIPQIFFDDQHIGGYDEVRALEKENKLQDLLK